MAAKDGCQLNNIANFIAPGPFDQCARYFVF